MKEKHMATNMTLRARLREEIGKGAARRLRREGRIPAVIYGHGEKTRTLTVDARELSRVFSRISVENTVITLEIEGERSGGVRALVREVQVDPTRGDVIHVDFQQLHAGEEVSVEVPIRLVGLAAGVRAGGTLQQVMHDLPVRCLADRIPEAVEVDVSGLEMGASLHVSDLTVPAGVKVDADASLPVCTVVAPTVEALEPGAEAPEGVGSVEPELIRKRPAEEESAGEA